MALEFSFLPAITILAQIKQRSTDDIHRRNFSCLEQYYYLLDNLVDIITLEKRFQFKYMYREKVVGVFIAKVNI